MTNLLHEPIGVNLLIADCAVDGSATTIDAYLQGTTVPTTTLTIGTGEGQIPLDVGVRVAIVGTPDKMAYELVTGAWVLVEIGPGDAVAGLVQLGGGAFGIEFLYAIDLGPLGQPLFGVPPTVLATAIPRPFNAAALSYDNGTSGLTAENVQAAIDELEGQIVSL